MHTEPYRWVQVTTDGGFVARDSGLALEFHNRIWISDGYKVGGTNTDDMLMSATGYSWQVMSSNVPYAPYAPMCVHNGYLTVIDTNRIMRSEDGVNWSTTFSGWKPYEVEARVFSVDGKLIVIRGSDVQTSEDDGATWVRTVAPWQEVDRSSYSCAMFKGKIYIVAGSLNVNTWPREVGYINKTSLQDVWAYDPVTETWEQTTSKAEFAPRMWPGLVEHDGYLWVIGGYNNLTGWNYDDTWRSSDGINFKRVNTRANFTQRHAPTVFSRNGRILLVAGNTNDGTSVQRDVWELRPD